MIPAIPRTYTVSSPAATQGPAPAVTAIPASTTVGASLAADNLVGEQVRALKQASGLTWAQFAGLFGVTRRAVHFWVEGGRMSADHLARLDRVRQVLNSAGGSTPTEARAAMFTIGSSGMTPFATLVAEVNRADRRPPAERSPLGFEEAATGVGVPGVPVATEDLHGVTPRTW